MKRAWLALAACIALALTTGGVASANVTAGSGRAVTAVIWSTSTLASGCLEARRRKAGWHWGWPRSGKRRAATGGLPPASTFEAAAAKLAAQYDAYKPFPDLAVNGKQTLGENIADVAGLAAAYDAYRASLQGKPAPAQDSFSGDQQFFIAFGQSWVSKEREEALREQVATDEHAPDEFRADTARKVDAWYPAFSVKQGEKLYLAPPDRVQIW